MATRRRNGPIVFGAVMMAVAVVVLAVNEWRAASRNLTLLQGERSLVEVPPGRVPIDATGRLLHVAGAAMPGASVEDPLFGVRVDALRLDRRVEMFQWRELQEGGGGQRSYRYERVWAEHRIDSERFRDRRNYVNPEFPPFSSAVFFPADASLGAFALSRELLAGMPAAREPIPLSPGWQRIEGISLEPRDGGLERGVPGARGIGDIRVRFFEVPAGEISVLAGLDGSVLVPWRAPGGGMLAVVERGLVAPEAMFRAAYRADDKLTWGLRFAGTLALFIGGHLILRRLARNGMILVAGLDDRRRNLVALVVAVAISLTVIAISWLVFRPLLGLGLLALGLIVLAILRWLRGGRLAAPPTAS